MDERHDDQSDEARGQKAEPEEHDRFDHENASDPVRSGSLAQCHAPSRNSSARGH
jgi:hypothetical protein